jgi:hypothetical protein
MKSTADPTSWMASAVVANGGFLSGGAFMAAGRVDPP